jgi:hypothetical protein
MSLHVDRPDFDFDESNEDIELWTVRVPRRFPTKSLGGLVIELDSGKPVAFTAEDGNKYLLEEGEKDGRDCFRALIPWDGDKKKKDKDIKDSDDDDSDDDDDDDEEETDDKGYNLQPTCRPFVRHFDVVADYERKTDRQVAPLKGPEPVDRMRHAYAPVPQRTGLKRRWMPPGAKPVERETKPITYVPYGKSEPDSPQEDDSANDDSDDDVESRTTTPRKRQKEAVGTDNSKEDRRSEKKARKSEKKSKKALKKEKKAEKKARKSLGKTPDVDV